MRASQAEGAKDGAKDGTKEGGKEEVKEEGRDGGKRGEGGSPKRVPVQLTPEKRRPALFTREAPPPPTSPLPPNSSSRGRREPSDPDLVRREVAGSVAEEDGRVNIYGQQSPRRSSWSSQTRM